MTLSMTRRRAKSLFRRSLLTPLAIGALGIAALCPLPTRAADQQALNTSEIATVDQLKSEAFKALKTGNFDKTADLLGTAASRTNDPSLSQMSQWLTQFKNQRQQFMADRHKQYEKAVADVHLLLNNDKGSFAIDKAKDAYLLSDDKEVFRKEQWVADLITKSAEFAKQCEANDQWYKALRLYADLSAVEPANPEWKDKLKVATRRMRLLAVYTPDLFRQIQDAEIAERDAVDALLNPTTRPSTRPSDENDSFRIDWQDTLKGIDVGMLIESLDQARVNYWKDVSTRTLLDGGLNGLRTMVTTSGLSRTFPNLGDVGKRDQFVAVLDAQIQRLDKEHPLSDGWFIRDIVSKVRSANHETVDLPENVLVNEFSDGAFAELDPFTSPIWPSDVEEFNKSTQGEFSGVGIQIQLDDDGMLKVVSPLEDSPAYRQGIKAGDLITRINGKNARGITINQAVKTITGQAGTFVTLTVRSPDDTVKDYTIRREVIQVASIKGWQHRPGGGWDYFIDPQQKIGYLRLTNFTKTTGEELGHSITEMQRQGMRGLIIDLRYNPGGLLTAATEVCDKFLKDGVIVSTKAERETVPQQPEIDAHPSDDDVSVPLVVLVNQYSASASEIVSGALKDQKRALIVGERTFGKGSVQMLFPLAGKKDPVTGREVPVAYLKLTTSHYYLPSGTCIHREENSTKWGVDPDVTIEMTPKQMSDAIEARQDMDVLRDLADNVMPTTKPTTSPAEAKKDLLSRDPQLSASLLLLRMELAGATLVAQN